jgi:hypothetical protein
MIEWSVEPILTNLQDASSAVASGKLTSSYVTYCDVTQERRGKEAENVEVECLFRRK